MRNLRATGTKSTPRRADGTSERLTEIATLARDMAITAISVAQTVPEGQAIRNFVRVAREFYSELDTPTPKPKPPRPPDYGEDGAADLEGLEY